MLNLYETKEIFEELQKRLIIKTEENETLCPSCGGLCLTFIERDGSKFVQKCTNCYAGKVYICKFCKKTNKTNQCSCADAYSARSFEYRRKEEEREKELFDEAEKISLVDYTCKLRTQYTGMFILSHSRGVIDAKEIEEWIWDKINDGEEDNIPNYLWATKAEPCFSLDIYDIISNACEDGYEDMYASLDTNSPLLSCIQMLIEKWEDEQRDSIYTYYEDYTTAVMIDKIKNDLTDLYNKSKK